MGQAAAKLSCASNKSKSGLYAVSEGFPESVTELDSRDTSAAGPGSVVEAASKYSFGGIVTAALAQVGRLIQQLVELRLSSPSAPPAHFLKRALRLVAADSAAAYVSVHVLSQSLDYALLVAAVGPTAEAQLRAPGPAVGLLIVGGGSGTSVDRLLSTNADCLTWRSSTQSEAELPSDWRSLVTANEGGAGANLISCVPVRLGTKLLGVLTIATTSLTGAQAQGSASGDAVAALHGADVWPTYMTLIASSLCSTVSDERLQMYLNIVRNVTLAPDVDTLVQQTLSGVREALGTQRVGSMWYRLAFAMGNSANAEVFDDLTQVPRQLAVRGLADISESGRLLRDVHAQNGIMHTSVALKNSVMRVAMNRRQQVVVPDVQKLINQSGVVCSDIFTTRLIKPPTSVLLVPIRLRDEVFGIVYCMSSVPADFESVTPALKELCDAVAPHMHKALSGHLLASWGGLRTATSMALLSCWSDQAPEERETPVAWRGMATGGGDLPEGGVRELDDCESPTGGGARSSGDSVPRSGDSVPRMPDLEPLTMYMQSRSATGALVTGLTEKLAHRRIKSTMDIQQDNCLLELRLTHLLGEGGFGKVFQGVWRGLTVGVKVVCDDGTVGRAILKNAHEIAILSAISHPSIIQAYLCLTDVSVRDVVATCFKNAPPKLLATSAYKYLVGQYMRDCHVEIIEFCDGGNLSNAIHHGVFHLSELDRKVELETMLEERRRLSGVPQALGAGGEPVPAARGPSSGPHVNMPTVLATLIEIASGMAHLHSMGVVHCDLKPPNVLLKSSVSDERGFSAKVTDFGLSRIQDSDESASFPYNSCGTAAYVAPEALNGAKRVNPSVDAYAFGVMMWEIYTGKKPYEGMRAQNVVTQVVMHNMRPIFPQNTPERYGALAKACWSTQRDDRPTFDAVLTALNLMLMECPARPSRYEL